MNKPLMAKATAVWLVDNTTLSFKQIADFCGMHELEVQGIADGDVAAGVKGFDPVGSNQLDPKRQDRPAAILWLVKFHPELADAQIAKLVGTTKPTIASIRDRTHWNIQNITPIDPVALGLCRQSELDAAVQKAAKSKTEVMSDDERRKLVSTESSLAMPDEPRLPSSIAGLENFSLTREEEKPQADLDADSFFNLPDTDEEDEAEDR